ncbi:hypothetical protein ACLOJK_017854 [Asimina triloba]
MSYVGEPSHWERRDHLISRHVMQAGSEIGVIENDGGGEEVVAADAEAEPEGRSKGWPDGLRGATEGETGGDEANDHDGEAVDPLAAKPAKEELASSYWPARAAEGDAVKWYRCILADSSVRSLRVKFLMHEILRIRRL